MLSSGLYNRYMYYWWEGYHEIETRNDIFYYTKLGQLANLQWKYHPTHIRETKNQQRERERDHFRVYVHSKRIGFNFPSIE